MDFSDLRFDSSYVSKSWNVSDFLVFKLHRISPLSLRQGQGARGRSLSLPRSPVDGDASSR